MDSFFVLVCLVAFLAGAYFLIRFIIASMRSQPKSGYLKKLIASVVIVFVGLIGAAQTRTPEQMPTNQVKDDTEKKSVEEKSEAPKELTAEEKAAKEAEEKAAEEKRRSEEQAAAERKAQEEAERQAKQKEIEEKQRLEQTAKQMKEITTGWNLKTTDTEEDNTNWEKASELVKKYPDYIHNAEANWISVEAALKKPWEYYGKVVNISGRIYSINQLPPNHSVAQFFGGNCYHAMLAVGDGYDPIAISMYIVGDSSSIAEDSMVNVKGYIFGHAQLVNRMGGGSRGLAFIGFQE